MNWADERYVRLYVRDTASWKFFRWEGQLVLMLMLRKVDRAGVIDVANESDLAVLLEIPEDIASVGLARLMSRGTVVQGNGAYAMPNFLEAQECKSSDRLRARESRARRRAIVVDAHEDTSRDAASSMLDDTAPFDDASEITHEPKQKRKPRAPKEARAPKPPKVPKPKAPEGYQETIAFFDRTFREYNGGAKPTWNGKNCKLIRSLVVAHGASTVQERIASLFRHPPAWLDGAIDVGTLSVVFDKLAPARNGSNGRKTPTNEALDRQLARVRELEEREAEDAPPWEV